MILKRFFPKLRVKSAFDADYDALYRAGIRGLIFDIDNTLVPHNAPPDEKSRRLMQRLKEKGFSVMTVSNNREARVKSLAEPLGIDYVYDAHKPAAGGYRRACRRMGLSPAQTACLGDQIFTDVWGANRAGVMSILVEPVDRRSDILRIRLKRKLEKPLLWLYERQQGKIRRKTVR